MLITFIILISLAKSRRVSGNDMEMKNLPTEELLKFLKGVSPNGTGGNFSAIIILSEGKASFAGFEIIK